jgi:hypothetical protein
MAKTVVMEIQFPSGFEVFTGRGAIVRGGKVLRIPKARFGISGFLSFNVPATTILSANGVNKAVFVAYNPQTRMVALRPVPFKQKGTLMLSLSGRDKTNGLVSFVLQARAWGIPMKGAVYPCVWDDRVKIMLIDLKESPYVDAKSGSSQP